MTKTTTAPAATAIHPDVDAWLAEQPPDDEIERLAGDLRTAEADVNEIRRRLDAAASRRRAVDGELRRLDAPDRASLLDERVRLDVDLVVLPQSLADAERGRLLAKLAVLGRVARLAEQEHAACVEQVNATMPELRDVVRALNLGESLGASGGTEPARRRALDDRRVALVEERAPLIRRGERAALVSGICRGLAERIDPTILLDQPHTWREGAGPAAERLARPQA